MPTVLQFRRGTTSQNNSFTGSPGELSIDTDLDVIRVHDGSTPGGFAQVGLNCVQTIANKVYTGTSLSVTGNITGGNLILSGTISDAGQLDIATTASNGNIVLTPNGTGNVNISSNIMPTSSNATANIGSATSSWNTVFAKSTSAQYADLAEMYVADTAYAPGTVVEFGGNYEITIATASHSTQVAGIISTQPAYLMNSTQAGEYSLEVALVGRVPCQVVGTIVKGDRLVSSHIAGVATVLDMNLYQPGCIIGKALAEYNSTEPGVIEVAVGKS